MVHLNDHVTPAHGSNAVYPIVSPACVITLHTYTFFAFAARTASPILLTTKFGNILVYKLPGPKTSKSARLISVSQRFM